MDEDTLKELFEKSQKTNPEKISFTDEESNKFKKAFEDPEFRKLFSEYVDEMQDPKNREENEAYISQLENEKKVPEGKELIRPEPAFVAKTHKLKVNGVEKKEKIFINVVQSAKIAPPTKTSTPEGNCWSVPYSLGPPHMEKDKKGDNAACFDCCFHPEAVAMGRVHREFRDLLVHTAMEGVEQAYKNTQRQDVSLDRTFHLVVGLTYKQGQVLTMMIPVAAKDRWRQQDGDGADRQQVPVTRSSASSPSTGSRSGLSTASSGPSSARHSAIEAAAVVTNTPRGDGERSNKSMSAGPAIKRGFLASARTELYPDKLVTLRGKGTASRGADLKIRPEHEGADRVRGLSSEDAASGCGRSGLIEEMTVSDKGQASSVINGEALLMARSTVKKARQPTTESAINPETVDSASVSPKLPSVAPSESTPGTPRFTVKERGAVGMGDFTAMERTSVAASRPSELVYRVELPLVVKASEVALDVAERQLSLRYQDVYSLSVSLPYPVFDSRGTAKFDKSSKCLTIILPVKPQQPQKAALPALRPAPVTDADGAVPVLESNIVDDAANPQLTAANSNPGAYNSRWVAGGAASSESSQLLAEVQAKARAAVEAVRREAEAQKATESDAPQQPQPLATASIAVKEAVHLAGALFQESQQFRGYRDGYVFRHGDNGLGYYRDGSPVVEQHSRPRAASEINDRPLQAFPFALKQTRPALALIVGVADILADTVDLAVSSHSVEIRFLARPSADGLAPVSYGLTVLFPVGCSGDGLDPARCTFDVASKNMAVALAKCTEGLWRDTAPGGGDFDVPHSVTECMPRGSVVADTTSAAPLRNGNYKAGTTGERSSLIDAMKALAFDSAAGQVLYDLD